jgi:hypothetical protein
MQENARRLRMLRMQDEKHGSGSRGPSRSVEPGGPELEGPRLPAAAGKELLVKKFWYTVTNCRRTAAVLLRGGGKASETLSVKKFGPGIVRA